MSYIYLASPYTAPAFKLMEARYLLACSAAAQIANAGIPIFSPIVHWHEIAQQWRLPTHADFWWEQDKAMIKTSIEVWVYTMPGWERSTGVQKEIEFCHALNKTIRYGSKMDDLIKVFAEQHPILVRS